MPDNPLELDLSADFDKLQRQVSASGSKLDSAFQQVAAENSRRLGRDRSWIATTIIFTYGLAILGVIVFIILSAPSCSDATAGCAAASTVWDRQAALLHDLVVTAVLPIVTLMLGFYFGTENARGGGESNA
jgi:hypothetical protein